MTEKQKAILEAMEAVEKGASISAAARQYGIPRSTLDDKIRGIYPVDRSKGPSTVLSKDEEKHLKNWIIFMAERGFPVTKAQLLDSVSLLIKKLKRDNPFQNDRPGRHWFEAFIKRHPEVGQRVAQNLTQSRALVTETNLRVWFKEVQDYIFMAKLEEAIKDPRRVFNCDESAFFLSPKDNRVLTKRGVRNVYNIIPSSEKECVTVLITANAAGELAPPMILFKLKSIPHKISKTAPSNWGLGYSPKGWMTGESFYEYMTNVLYPWIVTNNIPLPIIFFLDGHCSHTTLPLSNFCREKNIQLIALYPNATHLLQPMDVAVFRPLKRIWKKTVYDWRNENQFLKLKKENFCPLLDKSLKQLNPNSIQNGFRKCGLSPFDANSVDYSKCVTSHTKISAKQDNINEMQSNTDSHFKYLESQISPENLKAFYGNNSPTWKGDISLQGLFNVWRQMQTQSNLISDRFNNTSINSTHLTVNESPLFEDIGNFTGLTDILDPNSLNSNDLSEIMTENRGHIESVGKIELYENLDGTLTKIMDVEIPSNETSWTNINEEKFALGKETQEIPYLSGQVIRTTGSKPIYLNPSKKITTVPRITPAASVSNAEKTASIVETDTITQSSLSSFIDCNIELVHAQTQIQSITAQTTFSNIEPIHNITPPIITSPIPKTSTIADDTSEYTQSKHTQSKTSENMKTSPHTPIRQALPKDINLDQPKTKYYGQLVIPTPFKDALFWPETPSRSTKSKVKLPSVITSDRWQIFAQNKRKVNIKKEKKVKENYKKSKTSVLRSDKKKPSKKFIDTGPMDISNDDWFCRLCQRSTKLDMIQCVSCSTWYHTTCAEVLPNEITFRCMYCNVLFDE